MSRTVAGHTFNSLTPGERCTGGECKGIGSLVELMAAAKHAQKDDKGIAHDGCSFSDYELSSLHDAKKEWDALMSKIMGF